MNRTLQSFDRLVCLLVGAALVVGALVVVDWKYRLVLDGYGDTWGTGAISDATSAPWWPWAVGGAGVVLVLLGLWWLLAHLPRTARSVVRLRDSDRSGRLEVDLSSVATAVGRDFEASSPVNDVSASTQEIGADRLLVVRAHVDPRADGPTLTRAAQRITDDVRAAFDGERVHSRVVLEAPRRPRPTKRGGRTRRVQ